MKVVVLLAGGLGVLAFFLPYYMFQVDDEQVPGSAYELTVGFADPQYDVLSVQTGSSNDPYYGAAPGGESRHTRVPVYFWTAAVFAFVGVFSIWRKRMSIPSGLAVLIASLFSIGLWLNEINHDAWTPGTHHAIGCTLLGIAGLISLGPSIAVLYWREPDPVPLFKIRVPQARVVRR
jgi:hypothetical protein